ncbi:hypothetical protein OAA09_01600 [bacterium]|nr:hypothetical protein [bacterium]
MNKKIQNLKELEYYGNFNLVGEILMKLKKKYPENERIKEAVEAMGQVGVFVTELMSNSYFYDKSLEDYRSQKIRAIERARKAEQELEEIKKKWTV